jgi:hypothetical protein
LPTGVTVGRSVTGEIQPCRRSAGGHRL